MNKRAFLTIATADYYQYYIPIFIWSTLHVWKDVDALVYLRGELNSDVKEALEVIKDKNRYKIYENYKADYPYLVGTTNALRLTIEPEGKYDEVMITDVDFFYTQMPMDLFRWHKIQLEAMPNDCYSGHHGPLYRPPRPHICESWTGDWERVSCGFLMLYKGWWDRTREEIKKYTFMLKCGNWGHFRESDEVMLVRVIKNVGLPVAPKVPFPRFLRHIHVGDFKPTMKIRYENKEKLNSLIDPRCVSYFLNTISYNDEFRKIIDIVTRDRTMDGIMKLCLDYCNGVRGVQ